MKKLVIVAVSFVLLVAISFTVVAMNTVKCSPWAEKYFEECGIKSTFGKDASEPITVTEAVSVIRQLGYELEHECNYETTEYLTYDELSCILVNSGLISFETVFKSVLMVRNYGLDAWFSPDDSVSKEDFLATMIKISTENNIPAESIGAAFKESIF